MDQKLIIQALNSACGNKNFKFQVIAHHGKLHVYANHRADYHPHYELLEANVGQTIAALALEELESVWLYARPLNMVEPNWKVFVELPTQANGATDDNTIGITAGGESEAEIEVGELVQFEDFASEDSTGDTELLKNTGLAHKNLFKEEEINTFATTIGVTDDFAEFEDFPEADSTSDTGLLQDTGLIHGTPFKEEEFSTANSYSGQREDSAPQSAIEANSPLNVAEASLDSYCFVTNKKLLTSNIIAPRKEIIRLVKFFHHLTENNQYQLLPLLESYFHQGEKPNLEQKAIAIQKWFKQINELNFDDQNLVAIWLSRYCFAPKATLEEFKAIVAQNMAAETAKKNRRRSNQYSFTPASSPRSDDRALTDLGQAKFRLPPSIKRLIFPGAWILITVSLILVGIVSNHSSFITASEGIPNICLQENVNSNYCRLAANLAGGKKITQSPRNLFPMTEVTATVATFGCERYANLKAGFPNQSLAPEQTPVISSSGEQILPHIYVAVAEQTKLSQSDKIKVGCVYRTGKGQRSPELLAADIIPTNWPSEPYQPPSSLVSNLTFGILTQPISLGLYTIFAACGMAIASWFNLGIKINRSKTIYIAAIILGLAQVIAATAPFLGIATSFILPTVAILLLSLLVKDFQLNWSRGLPLVAVGIISIITIQFLLYGFCLGLINSWVS